MNSTHKPIDEVLLNVRKAYRLLHDYQRMVLGAVRYIGSQLDITYNDGWSRFAECTRSGQNVKLEQSSWDWLPMTGYEFHFAKDLGDKKWLSLSFFIISDTGFFEGDDNENDKENLSAYASVEESSTKLAFIIRRKHWHPPREFMEDKVKMRNIIKEGGGLPDHLATAGFVGKCYDLSCLASEDQANRVLDDILALAKANALPLERVKKPQ